MLLTDAAPRRDALYNVQILRMTLAARSRIPPSGVRSSFCGSGVAQLVQVDLYPRQSDRRDDAASVNGLLVRPI
jgi:hypothetical protein